MNTQEIWTVYDPITEEPKRAYVKAYSILMAQTESSEPITEYGLFFAWTYDIQDKNFLQATIWADSCQSYNYICDSIDTEHYSTKARQALNCLQRSLATMKQHFFQCCQRTCAACISLCKPQPNGKAHSSFHHMFQSCRKLNNRCVIYTTQLAASRNLYRFHLSSA